MTKVEMARKIVTDNAGAARSEIIALFMSQLNMSKAGATTYYYNVTKGAPKAPKAAKAPKVVAKPVKAKQTKEERLELIRKVAAKRGVDGFVPNDPVRADMLAEIEEATRDAEQYVREHAPKYIRQDLGLD